MTLPEHAMDGFAPVHGTRLYYDVRGPEHAGALVMLHAGICDHRMWAAQAQHFAATHRVVRYDQRGFGRSPMVEGAYANHEDLRALLDTLKLDRVWLAGCSMGGGIALNAALSFPDRVQGLILVCPAIGGYRYGGPPHPLVAAINAAYESGDLELTSELEVQLWVDGVGRTPEQVDPAVRDLVREMNLISLRVDERLWEQEIPLSPPALERLGQIQVPTLVIIGELDVPASQERAVLLAERIVGAKRVVMHGTAHLPNMERPAEFNALVDGFLRGA